MRTSLRRLMLAKAATGAPLNEYTATGNPLSFNTNASKPLRGLTIPFTPVQSGSGDPSPENVRPITGWSGVTAYRTGANVFDGELENGRLDNSGGNYPSNENVRSKNYISVVPGKKYRVQFTRSALLAANMRLYRYGRNKEYVGDSWVMGGLDTTIPDNTYFLRFYMDTVYSAGTDKEIGFNYPSTDTEYHPYTGQSYSVTFPALGKNMFDKDHKIVLNAYIDSSNIVVSSASRTVCVPCKPNTQYAISKTLSTRFAIGYIKNETPAIGNRIYAYTQNHNATSLQITTGDEATYIVMWIYTSQYDTLTLNEICNTLQVEIGPTATTYEPYTNTCYGGELDLVSGVLTVECVKCVPTTVNSVVKTPSDIYYWVISLNKSGLKRMYSSSDTSHYMSNVFYPRWGVTADLGNFYVISETTATIVPTEEAQSIRNTTEAMQWINQVNPEFVIPLETPITYQLTPEQITTLIGDNTIWSDTNGQNTAVYLKKG